MIRAAEAFVSDFVAERIPEAWGRVTEELAARSSAQRLGFIRVSIVGSLGAHRSIGTPRYGGMESGRHTVVVPLEFEKGRLSARIGVTDDARIAGYAFVPEEAAAPWRPPPYANPAAIREQAVEVVREGEAPLPGTLTTPAGTGPFPAVLLLQGAGPANRDAGFGAILPFRDLAFGLAARGIAVLRFDGRSYAQPERFAGQVYTVEESILADARAALALLREHPAISADRIFLLGHSMGGALAPRVQTDAGQVAGLILLGAPARPLTDVIERQVLTLAARDSAQMPPDRLRQIRADVARIRELSPAAAGDTTRLLDAPAAYWLDLRAYDPVAAVAAFRRPILLLHAGRDYHVTSEDLGLWRQALGSRGDVSIRLYPELNHLFMEGEGPSTPAEYMRGSGHVSGTVVDDVAGWIRG